MIGINSKNPQKDSCHIIEIQYGDETIETDIERLNERLK